MKIPLLQITRNLTIHARELIREDPMGELGSEIQHFLSTQAESEDYDGQPRYCQAVFDAEDGYDCSVDARGLRAVRKFLIKAGFYRVMPQEEIDRTTVSRGRVWSFKMGGTAYTCDHPNSAFMDAEEAVIKGTNHKVPRATPKEEVIAETKQVFREVCENSNGERFRNEVFHYLSSNMGDLITLECLQRWKKLKTQGRPKVFFGVARQYGFEDPEAFRYFKQLPAKLAERIDSIIDREIDSTIQQMKENP